MKNMLLIIGICLVFFIIAFKLINNSDRIVGVVVNLENNEIYIGPLNQNPEEQYAIKIVKYNNKTKISGDITKIELLKVGDSVEIVLEESTETDEKIAKEIIVNTE